MEKLRIFFRKKVEKMEKVDTTGDLCGLPIDELARPVRIFKDPDRIVITRRGMGTKTIEGAERFV